MPHNDSISELRRCVAFAALNDDALATAAAHMHPVELDADACLMSQGDKAGSLFVLLDGELSVTVAREDGHNVELARLPAGQIVGEVAPFAGGTRSASVRATTACRLMELPGHAVADLATAAPDVAQALAEVGARRLREAQLAVQMANLFSGLDPESLRALSDRVEWTTLEAGETLFTESDPADCAYVVVSGRLSAHCAGDDGTQRLLGEIGRGEMVGEYALIMDRPRAATVRAKRDTNLAKIPTAVFNDLVASRADVLAELTRNIIRRSETSELQLSRARNERRTIALVALDENSQSSEFGERLHRLLSTESATLALTAESVDSHLGRTGICDASAGTAAHVRLLHFLSEAEAEHRFVLYRTDAGHPQWTERAIRQADEVLFIADASAPHPPSGIESIPAELRERTGQRASLVLLHPAGTDRPRNTAAWLDGRDVDAVYHVRRGNEKDAARLARILSGTAVGLVLGGGGARGFAHLGVLRALEEFGISVDIVGGTSIGAPIANLVAQGRDAADCFETVRRRFTSLFDYTLPLAALLSGKKITRTIETECSPWDIEDLWLPYFCISTDITNSAEIRHRSGNSARAIRASVSIPGILPPVPENGNLLIDGGVLNNVPIDAMRELNTTGPVIAVDVTPPEGPFAEEDYGLSLSGWMLAANRLFPLGGKRHVPSSAGTILRAVVVGADRTRSRLRDEQLADLYINIDARSAALLDFHKVVEIEQVGYEQARPQIQEWLAAEADRSARSQTAIPFDRANRDDSYRSTSSG